MTWGTGVSCRVNLALAYTELTEELGRLRELSSLQGRILRTLLQEQARSGGEMGGGGELWLPSCVLGPPSASFPRAWSFFTRVGRRVGELCLQTSPSPSVLTPLLPTVP